MPRMRNWIVLLVCLIASPVFAVHATHWTQTTEADFKGGTFHNVVATNLGDLKLSRAIKTLLEQNPTISAVYALAEAPDGTIYAATGPQGVLLQVKDGKTHPVLTLPEATNLLSLLFDRQGRLLIGTGGEKGHIYRLDKPGEKNPTPEDLFSADGVQYVWAMQQTPDGNLYAATGPNGQLFEITPAGAASVVFDSDENNLLSLLSDGKDTLYVGTDPNGLVYRVNRKTKETFVLYDAAESEISALALDAKGNLYAGTAEASDQTVKGGATSAVEQVGRPEAGGGGISIPSKPPEAPAPPPLPKPNPGEPAPIPKNPAQAPGDQQSRVLKTLSSGHLARVSANKTTGETPMGQDAGSRSAKPSIFINAFVFAAAPAKDPSAASQARSLQDDAPAPPTSGPGTDDDAATNPNATLHPPQPVVDTSGTGKPRPEGNAIYRIDPDGFVTEIFRQPVLVLSLLERNGILLVGTGSEGLVYQVNPAADETIVLAKVDPKQVMSLLAARDGQVYLGMANVGGIASMSSGYASDGTYISAVLDASQVSRFGLVQLHGSLPKQATLSLATRSGNTQDPGESGWSKWSKELPAAEFIQVPSPSARYLQYRLSFTSKQARESAVVEDVDVSYQLPNLAPRIKSIKVSDHSADADAQFQAAPDRPQPSRIQTVAWDTSDANADPLLYRLDFRAGSQGKWILLKEKLKDSAFSWDTRTVADGRYEVRVTASDAAANPPGEGKTASRVSDPVVVDNTPPAIGNLTWKQKGNAVVLDFKVVDRTSTVAGVDYSIDSHDDWQAVLPSDKIFDGPDESVSVSVPQLSPGPHQVTLRATDAHGNQAFENVLVTVEAPGAGK